ncbi:IS256 family transposase [Tamlana agarivorans]|uniref:IS256 family transposase n=1 Tax=Pseudotamlana agarivorans TaxID=481183 RepID=A0ACC5U513_9FLAO|nr:IS256 family transposase [Tamlana agarivorans]MBU2949315.1 IS256 family transposase [Tamlana agarivorans]
MNTELEKQLEALIGEIKNKEDFEKVKEQLLKRGIESLLKAEMTAHLGFGKGDSVIASNQRNGFSEKTIKTQDGEQRIKIPRDREASFEPVVVPKHQSISQELEDCIQLLYAKGMSNSDIIDFIESTYGVHYSTSQVSIITNQLLEDIKLWQNRPLEDVYPIIWIDAIHYKIRQEGKVISKACMIVLGVNTEGQQDILSMSIVETEKAAAWMSILDDLRLRGVKDIFFLCSDNLSGLDKAVEAIFPDSIRQICIVHQIRNSLKYVSYKDRKAIMVDIKAIYQADNEEFAKEAFEVFKQNWEDKYLSAVKSWENNWQNLSTFLNYPKEIRKLIYTTNIIESFNASLRKYTRNKKVFPHDDAALKSIYLAAQSIRKKWKKTRFKWGQIYNQLYICFPDRL